MLFRSQRLSGTTRILNAGVRTALATGLRGWRGVPEPRLPIYFSMHKRNASRQSGNLTPNTRSSLSLFRRELRGRLAGVG